ncbi:hypothetical protein [Hydrogenophaga sp.]|uniref:hypothetical protein n=1 Tax=Hydrogenophaga sp. TaxID=1904254 RepID=UPI0019B20498|nr:hypothetical protein [Hydrogenophaga sp.]MBD3892698.1 hypothetical protein [Hydrogenophaga sp.]
MSNSTKPGGPRLRTLHEGARVYELVAEHAALARQIGGLQRQVGAQLQHSAQRIDTLETQLLQLRAQLLITRSSVLWGLGLGLAGRLASRAAAASAARPRASQSSWSQASQVICQTGCVGHAHPWLQDDGLCLRTGQACEQQDAGKQGA